MVNCILYVGQTQNFSLIVFATWILFWLWYLEIGHFLKYVNMKKIIGYLNNFYPAVCTVAFWQDS